MRAYDRPVKDFMTSPVYTVSVDEELMHAERLLDSRRISCLVVVGRDGQATGVISHTDILQLGHVTARVVGGPLALQLPSSCVGDVMTRKVISATPDETISQAARRMVDSKIHRLFVLDDKQHPVGVLSTRDILRAIIEEGRREPLSTYMTSPVPTLSARAPLSQAVEKLYNARVTGIVLVEDGYPVGLFTQAEAVTARELPGDTPVERAAGYSMIALPAGIPLFRAAAFALASRARRVVAVEGRDLRGIMTGIDFARAAAV